MLPLFDSHRSHRLPVMLIAIIVVNLIVFFFQYTASSETLQHWVNLYGMVPRRISDRAWAMDTGYPSGGLASAFTCMFLHAGVAHLLFNLWGLYLFGDNVEDRMGPLRFLGFYTTCGVLASVAHVISAPTSTIPAIGASGAIAGVLGAYLLLYPRNTIHTVIAAKFRIYYGEIPAWIYITIWFLMQLAIGLLSRSNEDMGGVAYWAHIGGFVAGVVLYKLFLRPENEDWDDGEGEIGDEYPLS